MAPAKTDAVPRTRYDDEDQLPRTRRTAASTQDDEDLEPAAPTNGAPADAERPHAAGASGSRPTLPPRPASRASPLALSRRRGPPAVTPRSSRRPKQRRPWYRRDPRLVVLAVAGVLIVGGAAVFGLTKIGESGSEDRQRAAQSSHGQRRTVRVARAAAAARRG